jgi:hypothetical protein
MERVQLVSKFLLNETMLTKFRDDRAELERICSRYDDNEENRGRDIHDRTEGGKKIPSALPTRTIMDRTRAELHRVSNILANYKIVETPTSTEFLRPELVGTFVNEDSGRQVEYIIGVYGEACSHTVPKTIPYTLVQPFIDQRIGTTLRIMGGPMEGEWELTGIAFKEEILATNAA